MAPAAQPPVPLRERPLLVGYYGEHNLGDDALLEVLLAGLPAGCSPVVTARDQPLVQRRYGVATVDRTHLAAVLAAVGRCDAVVFGGGTLLQDSTSFLSLVYYAALVVLARSQGKPVLLWGQGLGPAAPAPQPLAGAGGAPLVTAVSWRDPGSAALARSLGSPDAGAVGADPVWSVAPELWRGEGGPIVLCFRPTAQLQGQAWTPWLRALEGLAPERELLWLPFHAHQDRGLLASLRAQGLLSPALAARSRELQPRSPAGGDAPLRHQRPGAGHASARPDPGRRRGCAHSGAQLRPQGEAAAASSLGCPCASLDQPPPADLTALWEACLDAPPAVERLNRLRASTAVHRDLLASLA